VSNLAQQPDAWKRFASAMFVAAIFLALMTVVVYVYYLGLLLSIGSLTPTATQTASLDQFGQAGYVTPTEAQWLYWLRFSLFIAMPLAFITGIFAHSATGGKKLNPVSQLPERKVVEGAWKRAARAMYSFAFGLGLLTGALSFCWFLLLTLLGSRTPTAHQPEALWSHGNAVYITVGQMQLLNRLWTVFFAGMPILGAIALFLHFALGIKLFSSSEGDT
jgi:hypothetical protein